VDLPTPPLPLKTRTTWETLEREVWSSDRSFCLAATAAGEEKAPVEQADWLGQPAQAEAFPAFWEVGPTQPSFASEGASPEDDIVSYLF